MKHSVKLLAAGCIAAAALSACSGEEPFEVKGEGKVFISTTLNSDVKARSRATVEELRESTKIWISNSTGLVRHFDSPNDLPTEGIKLVAGNYVAEAWAGDSVPASFDDRYFKGRQDFTVTRGSNTAVEITCKIANSVVKVVWDETVADVLTDYKLTVGNSQGSLEFAADETRLGYFMRNSRDANLSCTVAGTLLNGQAYTKEFTIDDIQPATQYTVTIRCNETSTEIGGGYLSIEVDETEVVVEDEVVIVAAPSIEGFNFDINEGVRGEQGTLPRRSLWIKTSSKMTALELSCPAFDSSLGIGGNDFEIFAMNDAIKQLVNNGGINWVYTYDNVQDFSTLKLNFEKTFFNTLTNGTYPISISVTDANGKTASAVLNVVISDDPATTQPIDLMDVYSYHATITAVLNQADAATPVMKYRKYGETTWTEATTTVSGTAISAVISGLDAATKYEYTVSSGDFTCATIYSFTTEDAKQLPNNSFDSWVKNDKIQVPAASLGDMFWDSGNTAAAPLMNVNPTEPSTDFVHSGTYSARLKSQFVGMGIMGQFAAGNIFVGEFIRTDGMNGVIGWGRTWNSRPTKLRGWARYTPASVNYTNSDYPGLSSGDTDKGTVYVALLDNSVSQTDSGKTYPVIIKTKKADRQLFDPNGSNVIGYGQIIWDADFKGEDGGLAPFEITITYKDGVTVKPSFICVTASASIGGDYFVGGAGSLLYLDDLELVYE